VPSISKSSIGMIWSIPFKFRLRPTGGMGMTLTLGTNYP